MINTLIQIFNVINDWLYFFLFVILAAPPIPAVRHTMLQRNTNTNTSHNINNHNNISLFTKNTRAWDITKQNDREVEDRTEELEEGEAKDGTIGKVEEEEVIFNEEEEEEEEADFTEKFQDCLSAFINVILFFFVLGQK